jgi:hypothetical protein
VAGSSGWQYIENGLGRLSGSRPNADPFGQRDQFRYGLDLHFLHHPVAVGLDGALGCAQRTGYMLIGVTENDEVEDLPLTRRQSPEAGAHAVHFVLQTA